MSPGNEAKTIDLLLHHVFGFLDPLGNLHLLFAGEQRDLAHLLEIHPHRIIQDIQLHFRLLFFLLLLDVFLSIFEAIDFRGFDDVDLHPAKPGQNKIELVRISQPLRQRLI